MTYQAVENLKFKTPEGIQELKAGSILNLDAERAAKLLELKKIRPFAISAICQGCWAEWQGHCYAKIKGLLCSVANINCNYHSKQKN